MPPGGDEQTFFTAQGNTPTTGHRGHDDDAPPHSFPATETNNDHSPLTGHDEDALPISFAEEQHPVGSLPADVLAEILSRMPYRSLCRFNCVSTPWLALCSDPDIRKKSSQTLSGFFYTDRRRSSFRNLTGSGPPMVDPSLPFLHGTYDHFAVEQCSGGLLLCRCWVDDDDDEDEYDYAVCNPMTGQWTVLPPLQLKEDRDHVHIEPTKIFLGFDAAAVPSSFTVFVHLPGINDGFAEMAIYSSSSKTGGRRWTIVQSDTTVSVGVCTQGVFLNGVMHLATYRASVFTVDTKGEVWGEISMPDHDRGYELSIGKSQGRLHAWHIDNGNCSQLYVWVLEDYVSEKWTLKHSATVSELFGRQSGEDDRSSYTALAIHPDCSCIFLAKGEMAVSYDMDNKKVNVICTLQEFKDVLPYVPCLAEWSLTVRMHSILWL